MAYSDLREFITALEKRGELKRIPFEVDPVLEITEFADRAVKGGGPALLFEKPKGSSVPVFINGFASARKMEIALEVSSVEEIARRISEYLEMRMPEGLIGKLRMLPKLAEMGSFFPKTVSGGPCKEVIRHDGFSLADYPILKCWPQDGGRFITLPLVFTTNPDTGKRNCGMYRLQVFDERSTGMHWQTHKQGAEHYRRRLQAGGSKRMDVAVAVGSDPATMYSAILPLPPDLDEMMIAGFLRGKPVEMVKCETSDLEVPANAEIVLEGYVELGELRTEGPFGDHTGFYSLDDQYPVFHVTCITQRKDPIYATTIVGPPPMEDYFMGKAIERIFLPLMRLQLPEVRDISMPPEGVFHNLILVSIRKSYPAARAQGDARHLGAGPGHVLEVHRGRGRRCGRPEREPSRLEGAEQHRPAARHRVRDGPGRLARPLQPPSQFRLQDRYRRHPQVARGGLRPPLAGRDRDVRRSQAPSGRALEAGGVVGPAGCILAATWRRLNIFGSRNGTLNTPLYSVLCNCAAGAVLAGLWSARAPLSLVAGLYLILNGLGRFVEEAYRGEPQTMSFAGLRLYQWLATASVLAGATLSALDAPPCPAPVWRWGLLAPALAFGGIVWFALGVDFPNSQRRFSRLA